MDVTFLSRCRACQVSAKQMIFLFEQNLSKIFTNCTSLEISMDDNLPSHICLECFGQLSNFEKFRQKCANSDTYFREQMITESLKVEILDEAPIKLEENQIDEDIKYGFYDHATQYNPGASEVVTQSTPPQIMSISSDNVNVFDDSKFTCDYCQRQFDRKNQIATHMVKHKNDAILDGRSNRFRCSKEGCDKVFGKRRLYNEHMKKIHKMKPAPLVKDDGSNDRVQCTKCSKWFKDQFRLDAHIRSKHEGLKPYKCSQCDKDYTKIRSYQNHLRSSHNVPLNKGETIEYRCDYDGCGKEYGLLDSLKAHINRRHLGIIPVNRDQKLICDQCGKTFPNGHILKKHIYTHTGILPFACTICPKTFLTNDQLKLHTMRHLKVKPFECHICGMRKMTNKELQAHINFHTKEFSYPCKECPRVFTSSGAISRHVRIHHRNHKPYICPHCERAFAKAETMRNHVMTHTGEKPFACPVCDHRFIQQVAMKAHMKTHLKN